jgi:hypothetical protein
LPDGKGTTAVSLRVTGPLGFLVAKSQALIGPTARDKPKDAYDIVWLVESWPGGPPAAAATFSARPLYGSPPVTAAITGITEAFRSVDHVGARSYARFLASSPAEEPALERRAVGAIAEWLNALPC